MNGCPKCSSSCDRHVIQPMKTLIVVVLPYRNTVSQSLFLFQIRDNAHMSDRPVTHFSQVQLARRKGGSELSSDASVP